MLAGQVGLRIGDVRLIGERVIAVVSVCAASLNRRFLSAGYCSPTKRSRLPFDGWTREVRSRNDGKTGAPPARTDHGGAGQMVATSSPRRLHAGAEHGDGFAARDGRLGLPAHTGILLHISEVLAHSGHR